MKKKLRAAVDDVSELVVHGDFESAESMEAWTHMRYSGGKWRESNGPGASRTLVEKDDGTTYAVQLTNMNKVAQKFAVGGLLFPGERVLIRASGYAEDGPDKLMLQCHVVYGDRGRFLGRASHPGDGSWQDITMEVVLPDDVEGGYLWVQLFRLPSEGRALIDDIAVEPEPTEWTTRDQ